MTLRCYFNLVDGQQSIIDHDGVEVPDLEQARSIARATAMEMIRAGEARVGDWRGWRMEITDNSGATLFSIDLEDLFA
jgi:subtilisin-like proprotein convertase family protein